MYTKRTDTNTGTNTDTLTCRHKYFYLFIILNGIIRNTRTAQDVPSSKAKNTLILVRTLEYKHSSTKQRQKHKSSLKIPKVAGSQPLLHHISCKKT
jgi:hypothetical protein